MTPSRVLRSSKVDGSSQCATECGLVSDADTPAKPARTPSRGNFLDLPDRPHITPSKMGKHSAVGSSARNGTPLKRNAKASSNTPASKDKVPFSATSTSSKKERKKKFLKNVLSSARKTESSAANSGSKNKPTSPDVKVNDDGNDDSAGVDSPTPASRGKAKEGSAGRVKGDSAGLSLQA